jgi:predicted nucleic acid-binding protein
MKVYLDTCTIQRPLDDQSQPRIALETTAVLAILSRFEAGALELVVSDITIFEVDENPYTARRLYAYGVIQRALQVIPITTALAQRAKELEFFGIKALDALHVAAAEVPPVDYFCTCDDRLYRKLKRTTVAIAHVVTPVEFIQEVML